MQTMSAKNSVSTRRSAKAAGLMDVYSLRRKHVAVFFDPAALRAAPAILYFDLSSARDGHTAPVNTTGLIWLALSAEGTPSGFSKPMRNLTQHSTILYPVPPIMETLANSMSQRSQ